MARNIRVAMERASTARRQLTNRLTRARIATKRRIVSAIRTRPPPLPAITNRPARKSTRARPITTNLINTKVPIAHQKISIPAVIVVLSTKVKTKTGIASARKIRIRTRTGLAQNIRAAPAGQSTKARTRTARTGTNTRARAPRIRTNRRLRVIIKSRWM